MAGRSDIQAGAAFVRLYTKNADLAKGLRTAKQQLQDFGNGVKQVGQFFLGIGTAVTAALGASVAHFVSAGSALNDMSERTGMAAGTLAALKFAAEQGGASIEDLEVAIKKSQKAGKDFFVIADAIAATTDPALRTKMAMDAWGKSGTKLLPIVNTLRAKMAEAREGGLIPTEAAVKSADDLGDLIDKLKAMISTTVFEVGAALAEPLMEVGEVLVPIIKNVTKWVRENAELVRTVAKIAVSATAIGAVLIGIGTAIAGFGLVLGGIVPVVSAIAGLFGFMLSPVGLLIAGIALLLTRTTEWKRVLSDLFKSLLDWARKFGKDFKDTWKGIVDAVSSGDLKLAMDVALAGLTLAWTRFLTDLKKQWIDFKTFFNQTWDEASSLAAKGMIEVSREAELGLAKGPLKRGDVNEINKRYDEQLKVLEDDKERRTKERYSGADKELAEKEEALRKAQEALDKLRGEAARKARDQEYPKDKPPTDALIPGRTFATFSASALAANIGGGAAKDPVVAKLEAMIEVLKKVAEEELKRLDRIREGIDKKVVSVA
jgi:hypothetical protein